MRKLLLIILLIHSYSYTQDCCLESTETWEEGVNVWTSAGNTWTDNIWTPSNTWSPTFSWDCWDDVDGMYSIWVCECSGGDFSEELCETVAGTCSNSVFNNLNHVLNRIPEIFVYLIVMPPRKSTRKVVFVGSG